MESRVCEVSVEKATGKVDAVIRENGREVARISWTLGNLVAKDPALAMDMIKARFREWARIYHTTEVQVRLL